MLDLSNFFFSKNAVHLLTTLSKCLLFNQLFPSLSIPCKLLFQRFGHFVLDFSKQRMWLQ